MCLCMYNKYTYTIHTYVFIYIYIYIYCISLNSCKLRCLLRRCLFISTESLSVSLCLSVSLSLSLSLSLTNCAISNYIHNWILLYIRGWPKELNGWKVQMLKSYLLQMNFLPMRSKHCNTNASSVGKARRTILKNEPLLVTFRESTLVRLRTFLPNFVHFCGMCDWIALTIYIL